MASYTLSAESSCTATGGQLDCTSAFVPGSGPIEFDPGYYCLLRFSGAEVDRKALDRNSTCQFTGLPDGVYGLEWIRSDTDQVVASAGATISCGTSGGGGITCDLQVTKVVPMAPTTPGGFGYVSIYYTTANTGRLLLTIAGPVSGTDTYVHFERADKYNLPVGTYDYSLRLEDSPDCQVSGSFTIGAPAVAPDPSLGLPARWEPVGGVLPNPVLLAVEAALTDPATSRPRVGLHAELELWRPASVAAFASFRATIRTASQLVDAAPYLRAQLVALPRYNATASRPLVDADAALRFFYRFRVVDATSAEPWQERAGERYAVLAALPSATDTMAPYVADGTGQVASIFPSGEAVQFVGLPLETSVLLPPATGAPRWAELRYVDAAGDAVEIRTYPLADSLPAGMLRIPLPSDPPLCATAVEVSIRDDDRAFVGTCGNVVPPTPPLPGGTYADPIYGFY